MNKYLSHKDSVENNNHALIGLFIYLSDNIIQFQNTVMTSLLFVCLPFYCVNGFTCFYIFLAEGGGVMLLLLNYTD